MRAVTSLPAPKSVGPRVLLREVFQQTRDGDEMRTCTRGVAWNVWCAAVSSSEVNQQTRDGDEMRTCTRGVAWNVWCVFFSSSGCPARTHARFVAPPPPPLLLPLLLLPAAAPGGYIG
jgi:hypothetical protein